ncbi:hypothetical protein LQW54_003501 [Pestalotiopsis sp. IQ-011]
MEGTQGLSSELSFDLGDDLQEWYDGEQITGEYGSSTPGDLDLQMSNTQPQDDSNMTRANGVLNHGDVCYGMLHNADVKVVGDMAVLDAKLQPTQTTTRIHRFQLKDKEDHIQLSFTDGAELGLLRTNLMKGLSNLLGSPGIYFEAVANTDNIRETIGRVSKASDALVRVNINIYGPPDEADYIGSQLSEHKLWLQKPEHALAEYKNPHILEFEGLDPNLIDQPMELLDRGGQAPRNHDEHLRETVAEVYSSTRRQGELTQRAVSRRYKNQILP